MRKNAIALAVLAVGLAGGVRYGITHFHWRSKAPVAAAQPPSVPPLDTTTAAKAIVEELAEIQPAATVADWRRSHPGDVWHKESYDWRSNQGAVLKQEVVTDHYCVVFTRTTQLRTDAQLTRTAVFYLPNPPAFKSLPAGALATNRLEDECQLGAIDTRLEATSPASLDAVDREIRALLTSRFGGPTDKKEQFWEFFKGNPRPTWSHSGATVVIADIGQPQANVPGKTRPWLAALSYLPVLQAEYSGEIDDYTVHNDSLARDSAFFELAMRTASVEGQPAQSLSGIYNQWADLDRRELEMQRQELDKLPWSVTAEDVAKALQTWRGVTQDLPATRRAGALAAAYCIAMISWTELTRSADDIDDVERTFEAAGVPFHSGGPDGTYPAATWLKQALELDPDGELGDAITLASLSAGWSLFEVVPDEYKSDERDITDYVIEKGTAYLSRERSPGDRARVEYYIASAYSDRVLLGEGGDPFEQTPPTDKQRHRGEFATPEALRHYRSAIADAPNSEVALKAWRDGWRLLAGLPFAFHYYRFDD